MSDVQFFGESYRLADPEEYQWAMLEFADAATGGLDDSTLEGLAAVMRMLKAAIHPDDWVRFGANARKNKAQSQRDLMPVVVAAFRQETGRPTGRASDSSDGPAATPENSADGSSSPDDLAALRTKRRLEEEGRPDKALMVLQAMEARSAI